MPGRRSVSRFIAVIQSILFLTHIFIYETWTFSSAGRDSHGSLGLKLVLGLLSVSFVAASLLAYRYTTAAVRIFYRVAAVWAGILSFLFLAAVSSWTIFVIARIAGLHLNFHRMVEVLFGAAVAVETLRRLQRQLDPHHPHHGAPGQPAGVLAWPQGRADQRRASRPCAQPQFLAAHGHQNY